jgi:uncharacterized heparinase superfamily protein
MAAGMPILALPDVHGTGSARLEDLQRGIFTHLNQRCELGRHRPDWRLGPQRRDRLWVVTLHYHRWLYDLAVVAQEAGDRGQQAALLLEHYWSDWIRRCDLSQPGTRPLAWNAYAIATRLGWWVRTMELLGGPFLAARPELRAAVLASMWRQATFLQWHIEWDLQGNHLLRDAVGLAWAGRFFRGRRSARWLALATRLAVEQIRAQVLPDGGHFEQSPMYHLEVMADLLVLAGLLTDATAVAATLESCSAMARCAAWWQHPDGMTPQLNDGQRRSPAPLLDLARCRGVAVPRGRPRGGHHCEASGLVIWHGDPWTVFFDAGPIGPPWQAGHAHADSLTFEASWAGRRLFVDPGCYGYDKDQRRYDDRSTQAHNTLCIDGVDSSEVWHIFRVGRRANCHDVHVVTDSGKLTAEAWHDGYDHLPGRPRHRRRIDVRNDGPFEIADEVDGSGQHRVTGGLLIEPGWTVRRIIGGWQLSHGTDQVRVRIESSQAVTLDRQRAVVHPSYGRRAETIRLVWRYEGPLPLRVATHVTGGLAATTAKRVPVSRHKTRHKTIHGREPRPRLPASGTSAAASAPTTCREA